MAKIVKILTMPEILGWPREKHELVIRMLKLRGQHNMPTNGTNGTNGTNNFVPFGGRYSADIILFNQNHETTLFNQNCEIINYEYVKIKGTPYHTL